MRLGGGEEPPVFAGLGERMFAAIDEREPGTGDEIDGAIQQAAHPTRFRSPTRSSVPPPNCPTLMPLMFDFQMSTPLER